MYVHIPSVFKAKEPMSSTSGKTADVEAGHCPFHHPRQPTFPRPWSTAKSGTSRVSTVTYPMMSTSSVTTVLYPMSSNSQQPLAACRTLMNILCGMAVALTVFLALYIYCSAVAAPSCPVHADLDLQLACMPETLAYHDVTITRAHAQPKGKQCLDRPAQTLPRPQPCWKNISNGENNITCFVQKVFYQKWRAFEMVKIETATESPISSCTTLRFVSGVNYYATIAISVTNPSYQSANNLTPLPWCPPGVGAHRSEAPSEGENLPPKSDYQGKTKFTWFNGSLDDGRSQCGSVCMWAKCQPPAPSCRKCGLHDESAEHVRFDCTSLKQERAASMEAVRSYHYSCRGPVQDKLPRTSYKERLELVERIRTIRDISSQQ